MHEFLKAFAEIEAQLGASAFQIYMVEGKLVASLKWSVGLSCRIVETVVYPQDLHRVTLEFLINSLKEQIKK